jgi:transcriptional regulator with XRE-family HTH domain
MQAPTINFEISSYNAAMPGGRPTTKSAPKFGQRLAALRVARGLSQAALAAQLDTTRNAVLHSERAAKNVATFFGVGFDDLLGSNGKIPRKPGPTPQIAQLTERLARLPRAQQKIVVRMLESVFQKAG